MSAFSSWNWSSKAGWRKERPRRARRSDAAAKVRPEATNGNQPGRAADRNTGFSGVAVLRRREASQSATGGQGDHDPYQAAKRHGPDCSGLEGASRSNMKAESGKHRQRRDGDAG